MTDMHPNHNIESEIFPKELTREAQSKDVFTPPNHQQMRFTENNIDNFPPPGQGQNSNNDAFFITEDVRDQDYGQEDDELPNEDAIAEEKSYGTEGQSKNETEKKKDEDAVFDYGNAKMEYFKQRARQILIEQAQPEDY